MYGDVPFTLIHSNVWGPSPITTFSGYHWFMIFVDDCTRMTWLYLMKRKDDVFDIFKSFHAMIQTQFSSKIQVLLTEESMSIINFTHTFRVMVYSMKPLVLKHLSKMAWLSKK